MSKRIAGRRVLFVVADRGSSSRRNGRDARTPDSSPPKVRFSVVRVGRLGGRTAQIKHSTQKDFTFNIDGIDCPNDLPALIRHG